MAEYTKQFAAIASSSDHKTKNEKYKELLTKFLNAGDGKGLKAFLDHMLEESTTLIISRTLLQAFAQSLPTLKSELHKELALYTLEKNSTQSGCF